LDAHVQSGGGAGAGNLDVVDEWPHVTAPLALSGGMRVVVVVVMVVVLVVVMMITITTISHLKHIDSQ
jgi:hypothetical protein